MPFLHSWRIRRRKGERGRQKKKTNHEQLNSSSSGSFLCNRPFNKIQKKVLSYSLSSLHSTQKKEITIKEKRKERSSDLRPNLFLSTELARKSQRKRKTLSSTISLLCVCDKKKYCQKRIAQHNIHNNFFCFRIFFGSL